jgi:hypothetical protein
MNQPIRVQLEQINKQIRGYMKTLNNQLESLKALEGRKSERAKAAILDDIERIEATLDRLELKQKELIHQLKKRELTEGQINSAKEFAIPLFGCGSSALGRVQNWRETSLKDNVK